MKIALCIISKGSDEEAIILDRCLANTMSHIDEAFVTITQKNAKTEEVAKNHGANVSFFEWNDNYAEARNFNFSQVPKEFTHILWMDADDLFRGLDKLDDILEKHKDTDAFMMNYLYWFDDNNNPTVVHLKTQVVKNNGCVEWKGKIHEDLITTRKISTKVIENIERIHLSTDERLNQSRERNFRIASKQAQEDSDDPRSWFNLAKSQMALQMSGCVKLLKSLSE